MRKTNRNITFYILAIAFIVGCVPSLHPFYKKGDTLFDPDLVGTWDAKTGPIRGNWAFSRYRNEASYHLEFTSADEKTDVFQAHLFEVGDHRYLDLCVSEANKEFEQLSEFAKFHLYSFHTVARLQLKDDALTIAFLDTRWIEKQFSKEPAALRHERRTRVILTATTDELQAFIKKHAGDPAAWHHKVRLTRQAPGEATLKTKHVSE